MKDNHRLTTLHTTRSLLGLLSVLVAAPLFGETGSGWDARIFAGIEMTQTGQLKSNFAGSESVDTDSGTLFGASVGYHWDNAFGIELEYTYRTADFSSAPTSLFPTATEAEIASVLIFANIVYSPYLEKMPRLRPRIALYLVQRIINLETRKVVSSHYSGCQVAVRSRSSRRSRMNGCVPTRSVIWQRRPA
jgi:hypothetical protein